MEGGGWGAGSVISFTLKPVSCPACGLCKSQMHTCSDALLLHYLNEGVGQRGGVGQFDGLSPLGVTTESVT